MSCKRDDSQTTWRSKVAVAHVSAMRPNCRMAIGTSRAPIQIHSDPIQTTIFASSDTPNVGDHDGDISETKLTERQRKILNLIKESPTTKGRQMSKILSVSQHTIERDLSALHKKWCFET